ncbi:hypothetical protein SAMN05216388_103825 [Halorientalis persicus]|uniref:Uncharacterized protein n=1 Tax=Halorientalis persicus TaxID=1367881 RepID=A0A1H8VKM4_9EURY|nr:hypothetical protein [Halorientalis persicus]SEP15448.1 hypothetical protein SAMN05216388_103825 [Halorientalis persicus]
METRPITDLFDARSGAAEPHEVLRDYHYRRIDRISDGEFEMNGDKKGIILVHIATVNALGPYLKDEIDVAELVDSSTQFPILMRSSYSNYSERVVSCARGAKASNPTDGDELSCTWIDRTGIVEAISTDLISERRDQMCITTKTLEKTITYLVSSYIDNFVGSENDFVLTTMSYMNIDGVYTPKIGRGIHTHREIKPSFIETPTVSVTPGNVRKQLTPLLRPFWQAVGYTESPYMTEDGWQLKNDD